MGMHHLLEQIEKKGREKDALKVLGDIMPKMTGEAKDALVSKLECLAYTFTPEEAKATVQKMVPYGEHWSLEKVKELLKSKGIENECLRYYMVMNMMYNDYCKVANDFGLKDNVDFYFEMSKAFILDPDGVSYKVEKYFKM